MEQQIPFMGFNYTYAFKNILTCLSGCKIVYWKIALYLCYRQLALDSEGIQDMFAEPGILGRVWDIHTILR